MEFTTLILKEKIKKIFFLLNLVLITTFKITKKRDSHSIEAMNLIESTADGNVTL